ncbi:MAG: class I adenylate-forming enzyme family protein [Pseudomonadota bacterium]
MRTSPPERTALYRERGWWRGVTVDQVFREAVAARGDAEALVDPPNKEDLVGLPPLRLTYAELDAHVNRMAGAFRRRGVGVGDVVLAQLPNIVEGVVAFLAAARAGAILSPVAMSYRGHELRQIIPKLEPKLFLTVARFGGEDQSALAIGLAADDVLTAPVLCIGPHAPAGTYALDDEPFDASGAETAEIEAADVLTVCWTSGTEAAPKGVPRHHDHWVVNGEALHEAASLKEGDTLLNPFPLINIAAFGGMVMPWLLCRGRFVQHHPFDLPIFLDQMAREKVSYTVAPPAILTMLLKRSDLLDGIDFSNLKCMASGSAPLAPFMVRDWQERYGVTVMNVFGSNEGASLFSSGVDVPDPDRRARYFPRFGVEGVDWSTEFPKKVRTRLVDPETEKEIRDPGRVGELRLDGAMVFDGYWKSPDLTKAAFDGEGWFRTGDLFEIAPHPDDRYYEFVGRSKDIVIRGGVNISPAEIDGLVESHPDVQEACSVGYPDARLGERLCVFVVPKPGKTVTLEDVCAHLKAQDVAVNKLPEKLKVIDALPRNALGKVLRRDLKAAAEE